jgi:hypothetical protein
MYYVCANTAWSILWLACRGYYFGCAVGGCNYGGPHASRVIRKNWPLVESFENMHFWHLQPVSMHFYYAFLAIDFAFGIHGLVPGQQLITPTFTLWGKSRTECLCAFCNTKRASEDGWEGLLRGGCENVRDTFLRCHFRFGRRIV